MSLENVGLSTYSNGVKALKNLSLSIGNNMFGLLGPNGAGKSSLMRTIATLQDPDSGSVTLANVVMPKHSVEPVPRPQALALLPIQLMPECQQSCASPAAADPIENLFIPIRVEHR